MNDEESLPRTGAPLSSLQKTVASDLPIWALTFEQVDHRFPHNHRLNTIVAVHSGAINALACDVLVIPISSCYKGDEEKKDKKIKCI